MECQLTPTPCTANLLLVDDEAGFRAAVGRRLLKRGFAAASASSGKECLAMLEAHPADVVVLDVKMPEMNGLQTLKALKAAHPKTQVILLTGDASVNDGVDGMKLGAFDYLTKPVDIDHLVIKINQACEMTRLEQEKKTEQAYRQKMEQKMIAAERLVALGTMSTGIAHEINNPLAVINESAGLIRHILSADPAPDIPKMDLLMMALEKIEKSVQRAKKITHQLLGHVKKQAAVYAETDLLHLTEETLDLLEKEISYKRIRIIWEARPEKCVIHSDPYQIRQVLINLFQNAIDAVKTDGIIRLLISENKTDIILEVADNGMGISKENLGKIFDPFFTTKPVDEGTGLGLFVVHKILTGLDADIEVKSEPGKGSSFIVRMPKKRIPEPNY